MGFYPYKIQLVQQIKLNDHHCSLHGFAAWTLGNLTEGPLFFHLNAMFSDNVHETAMSIFANQEI